MRCLMPFLALCFCAPAIAQDLTVEVNEAVSVTITRTVEITKLLDADGEVIQPDKPKTISESPPIESFSPLIEIVTKASKVSVTATDANREPVEAQRITDKRYTIPKSNGRTWVRVQAVDFAKNIFEEETVVIPGTAPDPDTPDDPSSPKSLSDRISAAAAAVNSTTRSSDAATLAAIFRSVAGRAAGLHSMGPADMVRETNNKIEQKLSSVSRAAWKSWGNEFRSALEDEGLGQNDKPAHIKAWQVIAKALQPAQGF